MSMVTTQSSAPAPSYSVALADGSYDWYKKHAIRARRAYKTAESALVVVAAAIPTSAVLIADSNVIPAVLGAIVVVISGLRSVFHWQDNYLRFSQAREAIEAERRLYNTLAPPYDDASTRDQILAGAVTRIEHEEMRGWVEVASKRPKQMTP
jgi:hypothetical protein